MTASDKTIWKSAYFQWLTRKLKLKTWFDILCDQTILVTAEKRREGGQWTAEGYENGGSLSIRWASRVMLCQILLPLCATMLFYLLDIWLLLCGEFRCIKRWVPSPSGQPTYRSKNLEIKAWRISQKKDKGKIKVGRRWDLHFQCDFDLEISTRYFGRLGLFSVTLDFSRHARNIWRTFFGVHTVSMLKKYAKSRPPSLHCQVFGCACYWTLFLKMWRCSWDVHIWAPQYLKHLKWPAVHLLSLRCDIQRSWVRRWKFGIPLFRAAGAKSKIQPVQARSGHRDKNWSWQQGDAGISISIIIIQL